MAEAAKQSAEHDAESPGTIDVALLGSILNRALAQADPFSNPILLCALDLSLRIDRGELGLEGLHTLVQGVTIEAFDRFFPATPALSIER